MKVQSCVARVTSLPSSTVDRSTGEDNIIMCVARVTSLPSSTVDRSTGEDNIIMC